MLGTPVDRAKEQSGVPGTHVNRQLGSNELCSPVAKKRDDSISQVHMVEA